MLPYPQPPSDSPCPRADYCGPRVVMNKSSLMHHSLMSIVCVKQWTTPVSCWGDSLGETGSNPAGFLGMAPMTRGSWGRACLQGPCHHATQVAMLAQRWLRSSHALQTRMLVLGTESSFPCHWAGEEGREVGFNHACKCTCSFVHVDVSIQDKYVHFIGQCFSHRQL